MKRKISLLAVVVLTVLAALAILGKQSKEGAETAAVDQNLVTFEEEESPSVSKTEEQKPVEETAEDKTETVHVQADPQGNVKEISVEARLRNKGGSEKIRDYSTLDEIKNTKGDEEFTRETDGTLLWENHGEDIYYKGKSNEGLPVTVKVSYYLNGKEMKPQEIAGKTGALRIRFDYENHTSKRIKEEGKEVEMPVPFGVFSALLLPEEGFYNVEVTNGKVLDMEGQKLVLGFAFPGLADSLKLTEYEPVEEMEIPEYVELTADVTDFELEFTATVVTSGIFEEIDTEDLDDVDELLEGAEDLKDASEEMTDGAARLLEGLETFRSYMGEYTAGVSSANDGAAALLEGMKTLNEKKAELLKGAQSLKEGLENLDTALADISLPEESNGAENGGTEAENVGTAAQALAEDAQTMAAFLTSLEETLEIANSFCQEAQSYQAQVEEVVNTAAEQLAAISFAGTEQAATEMAKSQAVSAAQAALAETELSEDEKAWICDSIEAGIGISGITGEAESQLDAALETLGTLPGLEIPELSIDLSLYQATMQDLLEQFAVLEQYAQALTQMGDTASGMSETLTALKEGVSKLSSGSGQLVQGIGAFNEGVEKLYEGAAALSGGTQKLKTAGTSLDSGLGTLADGMSALKEGLETFDEEGVQKLVDLAGEDLENLVTRIKALKKADGLYQNYSGLAKGQRGSVKFIIETDEIEKM